MKHEEVIALAKEAGSSIVGGDDGTDQQCWTGYIAFDEGALNRFAAIVADKEREACAKVCETYPSTKVDQYDCADAIRAMKL